MLPGESADVTKLKQEKQQLLKKIRDLEQERDELEKERDDLQEERKKVRADAKKERNYFKLKRDELKEEMNSLREEMASILKEKNNAVERAKQKDELLRKLRQLLVDDDDEAGYDRPITARSVKGEAKNQRRLEGDLDILLLLRMFCVEGCKHCLPSMKFQVPPRGKNYFNITWSPPTAV